QGAAERDRYARFQTHFMTSSTRMDFIHHVNDSDELGAFQERSVAQHGVLATNQYLHLLAVDVGIPDPLGHGEQSGKGEGEQIVAVENELRPHARLDPDAPLAVRL